MRNGTKLVTFLTLLILLSGCMQFANQKGSSEQISEIPSESQPVTDDLPVSSTSSKYQIARSLSVDDFTFIDTSVVRDPDGKYVNSTVVPSLCDEKSIYLQSYEDEPLATLLYCIDKKTGNCSYLAKGNYTGESDYYSRGLFRFGDTIYEALTNIHGFKTRQLQTQSDIMAYDLKTQKADISLLYPNFCHITTDKLDENYYVTLGYRENYKNDMGLSEYEYLLTRHDTKGNSKLLKTYSLQWGWASTYDTVDMRTDNGYIYVYHPIHKGVERQLSIYDKNGKTVDIIPADALYLPNCLQHFEVRNNCFVVNSDMTLKVFTLADGTFTNLPLPAQENQIDLMGTWKDYLVFQSVRTLQRAIYVLDTKSLEWATVPVSDNQKYRAGFASLTANGGIILDSYSIETEKSYYSYCDKLFVN